MKNNSKTFLAAMLLLAGVAMPLLRAQTDASPDAKPNNSTVKVTADAVAPDNADAAPPEVHIDNTGVHIGGPHPVDINVPSHGRKSGTLESFLALMLPIISVLAVFGMPVAIVGFVLYFKHRRNRLLHETVRAMVEKGVPIPPELFAGTALTKDAGIKDSPDRRTRDLRAGLVLIGVGAGVYLLAGKAGLIPAFIGVALIVVWLISGRKKGTQPAP